MGSHPHTPTHDITTPPPGQDEEGVSTCKPIFTVGIPSHLNYDAIEKISNNLSHKLDDYHVLVYTGTSKDIEFQAFYPKELDERAFEELKEYVLSELKK